MSILTNQITVFEEYNVSYFPACDTVPVVTLFLEGANQTNFLIFHNMSSSVQFKFNEFTPKRTNLLIISLLVQEEFILSEAATFQRCEASNCLPYAQSSIDVTSPSLASVACTAWLPHVTILDRKLCIAITKHYTVIDKVASKCAMNTILCSSLTNIQ